MAEKVQDRKQENKQATVAKEATNKVKALSKSGYGTTLKVNLEGIPNEIIHGEIIELTESQLKKLQMASSSWSYEPIKKGGK